MNADNSWGCGFHPLPPRLAGLGRFCEALKPANLISHKAFNACVWRHSTGDWGEMSPEDAQANEDALRDGERVLSAYQLGGRRLWVITEADRTSTTLLLPEEY